MISPRIYIIIPRTTYDGRDKNVCMSCGRMAAQAAHASSLLTRHNIRVDDIDTIVLQVPSSKELLEVKTALETSAVDFLEYKDSDVNYFGDVLTAIILFPIERGSCTALNALKSWCCACNI